MKLIYPESLDRDDDAPLPSFGNCTECGVALPEDVAEVCGSCWEEMQQEYIP